MGKRKKHAEEHVNLERWLVSYADFITLLFATFVILYALSQLDLAKFKDLKDSLKKAFAKSPTVLEGDAGVLNTSGQSVLESGGYADEQNMVPAILDEIAAKEEEKNYELAQEKLKLDKIDELKGIKTRVTERGLIINMVGNIFFESSASKLRPESLEVIKQVGAVLKEKFPYNLIRVEGHSDNQPMTSSVYPSNWELSAARAASIVRYFIDNAGIEKDRFVVVGYGDTRPVATNSTEAGRNANRRVEIIVLKSKFIQSELQTYKFQKERLDRLKKIEEMLKKQEEEDSKLSDAAKKLLEDTKNSSESVILYDKKQNDAAKEVEEKLKEYEKETNSEEKKSLFFKGVQKGLKHDKE
ncbi:MAG: hypothetical protein A2Y25_08645 [Candidatus Melainabacteria bacterium GWF2_37_15]|nr:MAG: hypothetical protein A2Y25_08645 [Candidatus Melainabacteria bacterium GWF2_37_15]